MKVTSQKIKCQQVHPKEKLYISIILTKKMGFVLGPILGLVTNHTARILFEVSSTGEYIFKYMKEDDRQYTIFKYTIKSETPSVIQLKNLLSNTNYYYEVVDLVKGQTLEGKFTTLNQTFCMISPAASSLSSPSSFSSSSEEREGEEEELSVIISSQGTKDLIEVKASSLLSSLNSSAKQGIVVSDLDEEYPVNPKEDKSIEMNKTTSLSDGNDYKNISFVSCHNIQHKDCSSDDLWENLKENNSEYTFHLGDQVYTKQCKKGLERFLKDVPNTQLEESANEIKEYIREVYRKTWNQPSAKEALKTKSNLMMGNDTIFSLSFSRLQREKKKDYENFVRYCSYEVYKDYQRSLRVNPRDVKNCDYFLLQIGNVGYVVIDSYGRNFRRKKKNEFLGKEQIQFFRENMPRLSVSRWVVISTQPIFQTSSCVKSFYEKFSHQNNEITNGFTKKAYRKELKDFLTLFLGSKTNYTPNGDYKQDKPEQKIPLFISGDTHVGGLISIKHNNKVEGYQLISGGIQNHMGRKKYAGYRAFVFISGKTSKIAGFTHKLEWNKRACNYVKIDFLEEGAKIEYVFVEGRGEGGKDKVETFFYTV